LDLFEATNVADSHNTAKYVQRVVGMARAGKTVLRAQMVMKGETTSRARISTMSSMYLIMRLVLGVPPADEKGRDE